MNLVPRSGAATWLTLLEDLDCQWPGRLRLCEPTPPAARWFWTGITHTGGAASTVLAVSVPAVVPALASGAANGLVGLSRVVLGVHHLGDVLAGQALAILTTMLVAGLR